MQYKEKTEASPSSLTDCTRKRLAHGPFAAVDVCECGMLQIHVGAVTLRMTQEAFVEFTNVLMQAEARLTARDEDNPKGIPLTLIHGQERGEA